MCWGASWSHRLPSSSLLMEAQTLNQGSRGQLAGGGQRPDVTAWRVCLSEPPGDGEGGRWGGQPMEDFPCQP